MPEKPTAGKFTEREDLPNLKIDLRVEDNSLPENALSAEESYRRRKTAVTRQDYEEFLRYVGRKKRGQRRLRRPAGSRSMRLGQNPRMSIAAIS
jgi:hypothetical protein